jgi:hypothetical protein
MLALLALTAPWLIAVVWVVARSWRVLIGAPVPPSMAESARRRLAVR